MSQPDPTNIYEARRQNDEERKDVKAEWRDKAEAALLNCDSIDGVDADDLAEKICKQDGFGYRLLKAQRTGEWWRIRKEIDDLIEAEIDKGEEKVFGERAA